MRLLFREKQRSTERMSVDGAKEYFNEHFRHKVVNLKYYAWQDGGYRFADEMDMRVKSMSVFGEGRCGFECQKLVGGKFEKKTVFGFNTDGCVINIDDGAMVVDTAIGDQKIRYRFEKSKG